ncbi:MAG: glycine betaine ABC transporter substrate-binding protein [Cognatishimia sp.]
MLNYKSLSLAFGLLTATGTAALAADDYCASGKTVTFAGLNWESAGFITEVMKTLVSVGYDCKVEDIPGTAIVLENAVINNEIQIFAEQWLGRSDVWSNALAAGQVRNVGEPFTGASEGWFIPSYMVKGDKERGVEAVAPDLHSLAQLSDPKIAELFKDPEEPSKGRFLNCPSGWSCEQLNTARLEAYDLKGMYTNFRPGTGTALDAAVAAADLQAEPILFYYWSPTAVMGRFDLIQLEEPAHSESCWKELHDPAGKRDVGCAFPAVNVTYGINEEFAKEAPALVDVFGQANFPLAVINGVLADMADTGMDAKEAAAAFLSTSPEIWADWVSADAKVKIQTSLN